MLLHAFSKVLAVSLLAFTLSVTAIDDSRQIAVDGQRITAVENDVRDMKPLISQVAAMKQTLDTDHQILMAMAIALAVDIIARWRRKNNPEEKEESRPRSKGMHA